MKEIEFAEEHKLILVQFHAKALRSKANGK
jgi:hypothetical protein